MSDDSVTTIYKGLESDSATSDDMLKEDVLKMVEFCIQEGVVVEVHAEPFRDPEKATKWNYFSPLGTRFGFERNDQGTAIFNKYDKKGALLYLAEGYTPPPNTKKVRFEDLAGFDGNDFAAVPIPTQKAIRSYYILYLQGCNLLLGGCHGTLVFRP